MCTIRAEIIRVISKLNERAARLRFEITSMISDQNCTTRGSITTLLHPFWNCPNTGLSQFKYFNEAVLSCISPRHFRFWLFISLLCVSSCSLLNEHRIRGYIISENMYPCFFAHSLDCQFVFSSYFLFLNSFLNVIFIRVILILFTPLGWVVQS